MEIKRGEFLDISNADYHSMIGVNCSKLAAFAKSPAHYLAMIQAGPTPPTPAQRIGSIFHAWVLEGVSPVVAPNVDRRTRTGKEEWARFVELNEGKEVVTQEEFDMLGGMGKSILQHQTARVLFLGGLAERSVFFDNAESGLLCKCRPDYLVSNAIVDLKTTNDASPEGFAKAIFNYRYYVQSAFYLDGVSTISPVYKRFIFVAVEKAPPYAVGVYELDAQAILQGRITYKQELMRLAECVENDSYPGYSDHIETLSLPRWAQENENELF